MENILNYKSSNDYRHKSSDSLYAHYSRVDEYNCNIFPNLALTHPIHYRLKSGQSLYIPKNWWHWVKTTKKTFSINYWFNNELEINPFIFEHSVNFDISILDNEVVHIWNSKKHNEYVYEKKFKEFYNSGWNYNYLITLSNYSNGKSNSHIKEKLFKYVEFPTNENIICKNSYDYNIWISSNKHDTGLHYDDEDGILTVIEGQKNVILFPPTDSENLYPYEVNYEWKESQALNFRYNVNINYGKIDGICSGQLLYVTCDNDLRVLSNISKLYLKYKDTNLIWGFKKYKNFYRWEIYNYTLDDMTRITSWDIHSGEYHISDDEHYYFKYNDISSLGLPFWGYSKYKKDNELYDESKIFVVDDYHSFNVNYDNYMDRLGYGDIKTTFKKVILEKYGCYQICIHNKTEGEIFVQYLGISNKDFLVFLIMNEYPQHIIKFVKKQMRLKKYNINNEITIVYDIESQNIIRSGFYGNL